MQWSKPGNAPNWQCSLCSVSNWASKKVCRQCGARKLYAQALLQCPSSKAQFNANASTNHAESSSSPQAANVNVENSHNMTSVPVKLQLVAKIAALEKAKKALLEAGNCEDTVSSMDAQIISAKQELHASKPIGAQIDGCRSALDRAKKRELKAAEALQEANAALVSAQSDVAKYNADLAKLEAEVASTPPAAFAEANVPIISALQDLLFSMQNPEAQLDKDNIIAVLFNALEAAQPSGAGVDAEMEAGAESETGDPMDPNSPVRRRLRGKTTPAAATSGPFAGNPPVVVAEAAA